jgi:transposase-like protein
MGIKPPATPKTLQQAIRYFSDPDTCLSFMVALRWPDGNVKCPLCGTEDARFLANQRRWECRDKHPRRQFSIKVGTIFEDSPLSLETWLPAVWLITNTKNGISSYEIHRGLDVTQKTAWFMLHRIRLAMRTGTFNKLAGDVDADETYIGGKARFIHPPKRAAKIKGTGGMSKSAVRACSNGTGRTRRAECA